VLWLSGPAGKGKLSITQTIAKWVNDVGALGLYHCFDHLGLSHEKIFSTIACDLIDRDAKQSWQMQLSPRNCSRRRQTSSSSGRSFYCTTRDKSINREGSIIETATINADNKQGMLSDERDIAMHVISVDDNASLNP
jgi:hypothetical protein